MTTSNDIASKFEAVIAQSEKQFAQMRDEQMILADALDFQFFAVSRYESKLAGAGSTVLLLSETSVMFISTNDSASTSKITAFEVADPKSTVKQIDVERQKLAEVGQKMRATQKARLTVEAFNAKVTARCEQRDATLSANVVTVQRAESVRAYDADTREQVASTDFLSHAYNYATSDKGQYMQQRKERFAQQSVATRDSQFPRSTSVRVARKIHDGFFTVTFNDERAHRTLRIETVENGALAGKRIMSYLSGSDNESDYTSFAFVDDNRVTFWKKFVNTHSEAVIESLEDAIEILFENVSKATLGYALESSRCARCNRTLTVPASIHNGFGPECAKKVSL
jgi:hypothetical protein